MVLDFEDRFSASDSAQVDDVKPLARLILNQMGFIAAAAGLTPLLWMPIELSLIDLIASLALIFAFYAVALTPVFVIRRRRLWRISNTQSVPVKSFRRSVLTYEPSEESAATVYLSRLMIGDPLNRLGRPVTTLSFVLYFAPILIWISLFIAKIKLSSYDIM